MKKHAKKALAHEVSVLGKTVPTLAIAALFLVGGGTAALLTNFGTITGAATVSNAAIQVNGNNNPTLNWEWDGDDDQVLGETYVETHSVSNNLDDTRTVSLNTTCYKGSDEDDSVSGANLDWEDECEGIDTRFVEYYDEAGHNFSDYEAGVSPQNADLYVHPDSGTGDYDSVSAAMNSGDLSTGETLLVADGDYNSFEVDMDVTVVSENQGGATITGGDRGIDVTANGATVKGFEVEADAGDDGDANSRGIDVKASGVTVESNYIHNVRDEERPIGIHLWAKNNDVSNSEVINNYVEDVEATQLQGLGRGDSKAKGIALSGGDTNPEADNVNISYNTVEDIGDDTNSAMGTAINVYGETPDDFVINYNNISDVDHNEDTTAFGGTPRHPVAQGIYFSGLNTNQNPEDSISFNNFHLKGDATVDAQFADYDSSESLTVAAPDNFWGTNGIQVVDEDNQQISGYDWETKEDGSGNAEYTLSAQETDRFGAINSFQVNLVPATYNVTTQVQ